MGKGEGGNGEGKRKGREGGREGRRKEEKGGEGREGREREGHFMDPPPFQNFWIRHCC